ncbi:MAG: hypothetical protein PHI34_06010 [Acidobacteriota bacterium]|nr:hypothetical protein [Acidobacteriota bacterium]
MRTCSARLFRVLVLILIIFILTIPAVRAADAGQTAEWTFRVIADPAVVRIRPDAAAPAVDSFAKGEQVKSYAAEGAWIRFLIARRDGSVVIGYVAATDLEIITTKEEEAANFWKVETDAYQGRGFAVRLSGGYGMLGGGDIPAGAADRYQDAYDRALAQGYALVANNVMAFESRISGDLDILYHLSPRLAVGLGGGFSRTRSLADSTLTYRGVLNEAYGVKAEPQLRTFNYRAVVSYLLPIDKLLSLRLSGGPMLAHTKFLYSCVTLLPTGEESLNQTASATGFGAFASLALEVNLNEQASIFVEVFGRAIRISGFKGKQVLDATGLSGWVDTFEQSGTLYATETDGRTFLTILSDPALVSGSYHEAVYDLTGVDGRLGFKIRF